MIAITMALVAGARDIASAVQWCEQAFHLSTVEIEHSPSDALSRIRQTLQTAARERGNRQLVAHDAVRDLVRDAFTVVEHDYNAAALAMIGDYRDYIWDEGDVCGVDAMEWAAWARRSIYGAYRSLLHRLAVPHDAVWLVVDDRPNAEKRCQHWGFHRTFEDPLLDTPYA